MDIRKSTETDRVAIAKIHTKAFGEEKGPEIAALVNGLFDDPTAAPLLSLVAVEKDRLVGHILYTKSVITDTDTPVSIRLLAPLAVLPDAQAKGVGRKLIKEGLDQLWDAGVDLVFVLGHPDYYPRCGFMPAGVLGFEAPYPIPDEHAGAWMVQALKDGVIGRVKGKVQCAEVLDQPQHWRE
ncbi:MAG: N-acetyltransferase [Desulfobacteraceae bacterium]|nr:N-acetyltransferase [Desulfobacteraceae bacterium]MBC2751497.1 N-acetyltransferase [Desulfobacteraceae bacterium]